MIAATALLSSLLSSLSLSLSLSLTHTHTHTPYFFIQNIISNPGSPDINFSSCWRKVRDILEGLVHIHRKGLAHGDIKSGNMLVDNKGRIKLADFGTMQKVVRIEMC